MHGFSSLLDLLAVLKADAARYPEGWYREPGFWVTLTHRFGRWTRQLPRTLRLPLLVPQKLATQAFHLLYQVDISPGAKIGPGLMLVHPRSILIGPCKIGANCLIFHEVTLGMNANSAQFPELGDNVDIYAGARVLGNIRVGHNAKIGANCVVANNVTDGCTVVVARNRVIPAAAVAAFGPRRTHAQEPVASRARVVASPINNGASVALSAEGANRHEPVSHEAQVTP